MQFLMLGDLEVFAEAGGALLLAPKLRTILAMLLIARGKTVPVGSFVAELWAGRPPATVGATMQTYIYQLRKILNVSHTRTPLSLTTASSGYALTVPEGDVDANVFERCFNAGKEALALRKYRLAADCFDEALSVWRSEVLADVPKGAFLESYAVGMAEARLQATDLRVEAYLQLGRHLDVLPELKALTASHPLHEGLHAKLMQALHRSGRRYEALQVYTRLRRAMTDELGLEPSTAVQQVQHALLADDLGLDSTLSAAPMVAAPAQLPPDTADFTGREPQLARLESLLDVKSVSTAPRIALVTGMAGVGKSALAVRAAHRVRRCYPDGQFYADLSTSDSAHVLESFLRGMGFTADQIPADADSRGQLFRSWCADRRALVVLDGANCEHQVRMLLPAGHRCGVLVSSRSPLYGLSGASSVEVEPLPADEAVDMLGNVVGHKLAAHERMTAHRVVELCDHLPIAVRAIGSRLAVSARLSLEGAAVRLADRGRRLTMLESGDLSVRCMLERPFGELNQEARRVLVSLSRDSRALFTVDEVARLLHGDSAAAESVLADLVDARFLLAAGPEYRLLDLVRLFVLEQVPSLAGTVGSPS